MKCRHLLSVVEAVFFAHQVFVFLSKLLRNDRPIEDKGIVCVTPGVVFLSKLLRNDRPIEGKGLVCVCEFACQNRMDKWNGHTFVFFLSLF